MNMEKTTIQLQQTTLQQQVDVLVTLWMPFECRLLVSKIRKQPLLLLSPPSLRRVLLWSQDRNRFVQDLSKVTASETEAKRHLMTVKQEVCVDNEFNS